ncbi:MAG: ABC transporter permease [Verrucomicrobiales bacterium]|nr:ABC transporter permease [Verrucomicrobiales bacterium]
MSTITDTTEGAVPKKFKSKKLLRYNPNRVAHTFDQLGLGYFSPIARLIGGDEPKKQLREIVSNTFLPILAFAIFIGVWGICSKFVVSDSTRIPSPAQTWVAWQGMVDFAEAEKIKEIDYYEANEERALKMEAKAKTSEEAGELDKVERYNGMAEKFRSKVYQGATTFFDQIGISLITVAVGFLAACILGVPVGILCGISKRVNIALNPIIQLFKPVSPLAWFPIVFVFTTWGIEQPESTSIWQRALWTSAGVVTLCSIWPTLINTAVGVASVDKDHLNVAKVLKLGWFKRIWKIVLPSSLPLIFTGLRLSIGVGWMVLVASDMMAQNQGLGKFVWDMYQNGDTQSTAQIIIAVFFIGAIGFLLDRVMLVCQRLVTFEEQTI